MNSWIEFFFVLYRACRLFIQKAELWCDMKFQHAQFVINTVFCVCYSCLGFNSLKYVRDLKLFLIISKRSSNVQRPLFSSINHIKFSICFVFFTVFSPHFLYFTCFPFHLAIEDNWDWVVAWKIYWVVPSIFFIAVKLFSSWILSRCFVYAVFLV